MHGMAWFKGRKSKRIEKGIGGFLGPFLGYVGCARPGARTRTGAVREAGFGRLVMSKATARPMASTWAIKEAKEVGER